VPELASATPLPLIAQSESSAGHPVRTSGSAKMKACIAADFRMVA